MLPGADEMIAARIQRAGRIRRLRGRGRGIKITNVQETYLDLCVRAGDAADLADLEDMEVDPWPCEIPIPHHLLL